MDHGPWRQATDAGGRLYFFNEVTRETRWDRPGDEQAPLAVQNAFALALQQLAEDAPVSRELAERCLGQMRRDAAQLTRLDAWLAAAVADGASQALLLHTMATPVETAPLKHSLRLPGCAGAVQWNDDERFSLQRLLDYVGVRPTAVPSFRIAAMNKGGVPDGKDILVDPSHFLRLLIRVPEAASEAVRRLMSVADRGSQLDAQLAAAIADRDALATTAAESRRAAADLAVASAAGAAANARSVTSARLPDVDAAWARAWPAPPPAPVPAPPHPDDAEVLRALFDDEEAGAPPPPDADSEDDDMALDRAALLQPAARWPGVAAPTAGDSTDDDDVQSLAPRPARAPKRPKKLDDAALSPKKRARVSTDGAPLARAPPGTTAAAPGSIMATAKGQLSASLFTKKQILELMPSGQGSYVPAVYAAGGVIYALCFSEDSNPGLPTVVEISCGAQRKKQVQQFEQLKQRGGAVPLFVCLLTARGKVELLPGGSSKGFRFAGLRSIVSVELHATPKMVGGEARQATVTLSAPTAGGTCPLQVTGVPRDIQVVGASASAPAPAPPLRPAAPPVTPRPAPPRFALVRCPASACVGETIEFENEGRRFKVIVPAGVLAGDQFRVPLPG